MLRRPSMPAASTIRPPANYIPPVTAVSMHTEGEAGPPKIACLMSLVIPALEESPPHYTQEPATYYMGGYSRPLPENRKRRLANTVRQPNTVSTQTRGGQDSGSAREEGAGRDTRLSQAEDVRSAG